MRRTVAVRVLAGVLVLGMAASCSDDGSGDGQAGRLADRAGFEADEVVDAICEEWRRDDPDAATINQYVRDLLLPLALINSQQRPSYDTEDIEALVEAACDDGADPEALVDRVLEGLGLGEADLDRLVSAACDRYGEQLQRMARGDWSGEDLGQLIRDVAGERGVDLEELKDAITGVCADR